MPSKSKAQHRLMEAAAHSSGGYDGVPQSVGREFVDADEGDRGDAPKSKFKMKPNAKFGSVRSKTSTRYGA